VTLPRLSWKNKTATKVILDSLFSHISHGWFNKKGIAPEFGSSVHCRDSLLTDFFVQAIERRKAADDDI